MTRQAPAAAPRFSIRTAAVLWLLFAGQATAEDRYYLLMFGSQRTPNHPSHNHTFATFVRADSPSCGMSEAIPAGDAAKVILQVHTISWLPEDGRVRGLALLPQAGRNFDLDATLRSRLDDGQRVSLWGPFEIQLELYQRALDEIALLESGSVRYKSFDAGYRSDRVTNCSHAVRSMIEGQRRRGPAWFGGDGSAFHALRGLTPWLIEADRTHAWVATAVGLDHQPIVYRAPGESPYSLSRILGRGRGK